MEPITPSEENPVSDVIQETVQVVEQVSEYGYLITNSLYLFIGGMLTIFLLHTLASKFLYPHLKNTRLIKVVFGTLYVLILAIVVLIALRELGFDVKDISKISIMVILVGAVVIFFLVPFLPRLPFVLGHVIETNGVLGSVDSISTFHTTIRKFDGTMVFIPNAIVLASKIMNYNDTPERRIEMTLNVSLDSNMEETKALLLRLMNEDERVLDEPSPPSVFVMDANAVGFEIAAYCWVKNEEWLSARSDLWLSIVDAVIKDDHVSMSRPQQDVYVVDKNAADQE